MTINCSLISVYFWLFSNMQQSFVYFWNAFLCWLSLILLFSFCLHMTDCDFKANTKKSFFYLLEKTRTTTMAMATHIAPLQKVILLAILLCGQKSLNKFTSSFSQQTNKVFADWISRKKKTWTKIYAPLKIDFQIRYDINRIHELSDNFQTKV